MCAPSTHPLMESSTASDAANIGFHDYPNLKDVGDLKNVSTKMPNNGDDTDQAYSDWQHMTCKSYVLPMLHPSKLDDLLNDRPNIRINPMQLTVRELIAIIQSQYSVKFKHSHIVSDDLKSRESRVVALEAEIKEHAENLGLGIDDREKEVISASLRQAKSNLVEAKKYRDAFPDRSQWSYKIPPSKVRDMDKEKLFLMELGAMLHVSILAYEDDMKAYNAGGSQALADRYNSFIGDQRTKVNPDYIRTPSFAADISLDYKDWDDLGIRYPEFGQIYTFIPAPIILFLHLRYPMPFHVLPYSTEDINTFSRDRQDRELKGNASIFPSSPQLWDTLKTKPIVIMNVWTEAGFFISKHLWLKKVSPKKGIFENSMWTTADFYALPDKDTESIKKYYMKHTWNSDIFACISPGFADWVMEHRTTFKKMAFHYNKYTAKDPQQQRDPVALNEDVWHKILAEHVSTFTAMD